MYLGQLEIGAVGSYSPETLEYSLAVELYANRVDPPPLPRDQLEAAVTEAIFVSYDNATNGNKTRGGIKRASDM